MNSRTPLWWAAEQDKRERETIQNAANALENARVNYDRLVAHRTDRLNRLRVEMEKYSKEMG